jgi:hypothetical protein
VTITGGIRGVVNKSIKPSKQTKSREMHFTLFYDLVILLNYCRVPSHFQSNFTFVIFLQRKRGGKMYVIS